MWLQGRPGAGDSLLVALETGRGLIIDTLSSEIQPLWGGEPDKAPGEKRRGQKVVLLPAHDTKDSFIHTSSHSFIHSFNK